jgi:serine/threonine-protein kinase
MNELIGRDLGQYHIIEKIGEGGQATVYRCYQPILKRYVALKVLPRHAEQSRFVRFQREAEAIASLEHRHILPIYDCGQQEGYDYIAMRYIDGGRTLKDVMADSLDLAQAALLIEQIAAALDYAHRQGVIHRDVKPSNVLMDGDWAYLADFGLARQVEPSETPTGSDRISGTIEYMAPEQAMEKVSPQTDIYSLGIVLFEMLTGKIPHKACTPAETLANRIRDPPPRPRDDNPDIHEAVEQVIMKALAHEPRARFTSAGEMAEALQKAASESAKAETGEPVPVYSEGDAPPAVHGNDIASSEIVTTIRSSACRLVKPARLARPWKWAAGVGSVVVVLGLLAWALGQGHVRIGPPTAVPTVQVAVGLLPTATSVAPTPTNTLSPAPSSTPIPAPMATDTVAPTSTPTPTPTATSIPTDTPTATLTQSLKPRPTETPTATPTATPRWLPAPQLLAPPQGSHFAGWNAKVDLRWSAVEGLRPDEFYVLRIPYDDAGGVAEFWRQDTSFGVPSHFSRAEVGFPDRHYDWSVQVMRCTSKCSKALDLDAKDQGVTGEPVGNRSEKGVFYWHSDVGGNGSPGNGTKPTSTPWWKE